MQNGEEKIVNETVYTYKDYPYHIVHDYDTCGYRTTYVNVPCAFDIEVTTIPDPNYVQGKTKNGAYGILYQWQFCIDTFVCFGRTIQEYMAFIQRLYDVLTEGGTAKALVIYVHNLAYEWQFIHDYFEWDNIFARKPRQVLKANERVFEYRCSYILSNKSLVAFCKSSEGCVHYKLTDSYDYRKLRYPHTPLTDLESAYCYNDVRGLCECIRALLRDDNLQTIPLTSTGFVRRDCRKAMQENPENTYLFRRLALSPELYLLCRDCFRGGDVHCNYLYTGSILEGLESWDLKSSYPAWMLMEKFPMSPFAPIEAPNLSAISTKRMWITRVAFRNIKLKPDYYIPYLSISQCQKFVAPKADNGRILSAEYIEIAITNLDWEIIKKEYSWDEYATKETYVSKPGYLPVELRRATYTYFLKKCELDGVEGAEYEYMRSKNKLNGIFGMMVTDILQSELEFDPSLYVAGHGGWRAAPADVESILAHYYKSRHNFLAYQWGIFVTAWARYHLREAIWELGSDHVYNDTDCTKGYPGHEQWFKDFNSRITARAKSMDVPAYWTSPEGREIVLGCWEHELTYEKFRSWGSKKYCGTFYKHGKLQTQITVAGVNKAGGSRDIARDGIEAFEPGYTFRSSGRTTATYQDCPVHEIELDGHTYLQASSIAIEDTTYTLGITNEYQQLISNSLLTKQRIHDILEM